MEVQHQILSISEVKGKSSIHIYLDSVSQNESHLTIPWCCYCWRQNAVILIQRVCKLLVDLNGTVKLPKKILGDEVALFIKVTIFFYKILG